MDLIFGGLIAYFAGTVAEMAAGLAGALTSQGARQEYAAPIQPIQLSPEQVESYRRLFPQI